MARDKKAPEHKTGVAAWNESAGIQSRAQATSAGKHDHATRDKRKRTILLVVLLALCIASIVCAWPFKEVITRGLWLKGGTAYTMAATNAEGAKPSQDELSSAASTIQGRLGSAEISEYAVGQSGDDALTIKLSDLVDNGENIAKIVGGAGHVEFVRADQIGDADALLKMNAGTMGVQMAEGTYTSFLDGSAVKEASVVDAGTGYYAIHVVFDEAGTSAFAEMSKELAEAGGGIVVAVDGCSYATMSVSEEVTNGQIYITGTFTKEVASALKAVLVSETIPLTLSYQGSQSTGPLLGKPMLWGLVAASALAFVIVTVLAYRKFKKLAVLIAGSMIVYASLMFGFMSLASRLNMFVLTMPGVFGAIWAGVTTIMAVWLMCARFQSKVLAGGSIKGTAKSAPIDALRSLLMPCVVAGVVASVLLFVPMPALHDFGVVIIFGIVSGLAAIAWYAITLLRLLAAGSMQNDAEVWGIASQSTEEATA